MALTVLDLVSLATLKAHLRLGSSTAEDTLLELYLAAAVDLVERTTGRALLDRTRTATFDSWLTPLCLSWAPLLSVTSITYLDAAGASQPFTAYTTSGLSAPDGRGRIHPTPDATLPELYAESQPGMITITYVAGYTTSSGQVATHIPSGLRLAVMFLAAQMFEQRLPSSDVEHFTVPFTLQALLDSFRLPSL